MLVKVWVGKTSHLYAKRDTAAGFGCANKTSFKARGRVVLPSTETDIRETGRGRLLSCWMSSST